MIYVATVHWRDARWIELQHRYLKRFITEPFCIVGDISGISEEYHRYFDYVFHNDDLNHAEKLNFMAHEISSISDSANDWLIFLDGDAFPIAAMVDWMREKLETYPLLAVQRIENIGDIQPHPCFSGTTVGFWQSIKGDWREGHAWQLTNGTMQTDVGGNLLQILEGNAVEWYKMHRTNTVDLDDLMFGVYENIVYHHGAGFRSQKGGRIALDKAGSGQLFRRLDVRILEKCVPKKYLMDFRYSLWHPYGRLRARLFRQLSRVSDEVFQNLVSDPDYVYTFIDSRVKHRLP